MHWLFDDVGMAYLKKEYVEGARSANDLAKELGVYPNLVLRALKRHGFAVRDRSEARKTGLSKGRLIPPMFGKAHSEEARARISAGVRKRRGKAETDTQNPDQQEPESGAQEQGG